jgi:hypothetical protein
LFSRLIPPSGKHCRSVADSTKLGLWQTVNAQLVPFPGRATAVEGYAPNLPIARRRLEPLGVRVFGGATRSGMPF